ncbi:MAG: TonB family protein [Alphaproteobacteria bacterium]|nr:TonB family protein [Alphaproteobacteria bacterium]
MRIDVATRRDRLTAAVAVAALEAVLGYALITGLHVVRGLPAADPLQVIGLAPTPPPPPPKKPKPPPKPRTRSPEGAASPPNLKATPTEIVRPPPPPILFPPPPPVAAAPIAGPGAAPSAGAAPVPGPGTGAGGEGNGTGSGAGGNGTGSGGGRGRGKPPKHLHGRITNDDYPPAAKAAGAQGGLWVRYTVLTSGRATNCRILRSSGTASLDQTTCRLIVERFVFRPAKDERGQPVQADLVEEHEWIMDEKNPPPEPDGPDPD